MERKNYFNFLAFRKGLYDIELSERARVIYMHLLQKSSAKGSDEIELTKALIASDLGILTKKRDALAPKNVQRALDELEDRNYIQRWQKYKGDNSPLTIKLNLDEAFLRQKREDIDSYSNKNEQSESEEPSENVHHYNPYLSSSNQSLSGTNLDLSSSNSVTRPTTYKELTDYFIKRMQVETKNKDIDELNEIQEVFKTELDEFNEINNYQDIYKFVIKPSMERIKEKLLLQVATASGEATSPSNI